MSKENGRFEKMPKEDDLEKKNKKLEEEIEELKKKLEEKLDKPKELNKW